MMRLKASRYTYVGLLAFLAFYIDFTFGLQPLDSTAFLMWICLSKMRFT